MTKIACSACKAELIPIALAPVQTGDGFTCLCGAELPGFRGYRALLCNKCCRIYFGSVFLDLFGLTVNRRRALCRQLLPKPTLARKNSAEGDENECQQNAK